MQAMKDISDNILYAHSDIENCFLNFYKNLWSSSFDFNLDSLLNAMPDDLLALCMEDYDVLIRPITKQEVYKTLTSMPRGKSPVQMVSMWIFTCSIGIF